MRYSVLVAIIIISSSVTIAMWNKSKINQLIIMV